MSELVAADLDVTEIVGNGLVTWTFLASLAFVITYHFTAKWWESSFGKSLMIYQLAMTAVLFLALPIFPDNPNPIIQITGLVIFSVVPVALTWRIFVLIRVQRRIRRDRMESERES